MMPERAFLEVLLLPKPLHDTSKLAIEVHFIEITEKKQDISRILSD